MQKPIVSIIMPVKDGQDYVKEAIESILQQSVGSFEFIIVDDGSTDDTSNILESYKKTDNRIIILKNPTSEGIVSALNKGLSIATGKYIARMDHDDISLPNRLEKQIQFLEQNPEIFLIGTGAYLMNEAGQTVKIFRAISDPELQRSRLYDLKVLGPMHPSIMFRNTKEFAYREKARYTEDIDLYLQLAGRNKKISNIAEPLIKYRLRKNSISFANPIRQQAFVKAVQKIHTSKDPEAEYAIFDNSSIIEESTKALTEERKLYFTAKYYLAVRDRLNIVKTSLLYIQNYGLNLKIIGLVVFALLPKVVLDKMNY